MLWCMMNALQLMIYIGLVNLAFPLNVKNMFSVLLSFVNFDLFKIDDLNAEIYDLNDDHPLNERFNDFDIF